MNKSRKSIIHQVSKRFQTTIIGSLARIEDTFGYLWGHDSYEELTDQQQHFADMWENIRTSILNHGNNQMREAIDEIIEYLDIENDTMKHKITLINPSYLNKKEDKK